MNELQKAQALRERFFRTMSLIVSLQKLRHSLDENHKRFWEVIRSECEMTDHAEITSKADLVEFEAFEQRIAAGEVLQSDELEAYSRLKARIERCNRYSGRRGSCPYCGKLLSDLYTCWDDKLPLNRERIDYQRSLLTLVAEDWPESKRGLLKKIQEGVAIYLDFLDPIEEREKTLVAEQIENRKSLKAMLERTKDAAVDALCKDALAYVPGKEED